MKKAIFYGVGVGPGDPELLTLKAVRVIRACEVLAVPGRTKQESVAYRIARAAIPMLEETEKTVAEPGGEVRESKEVLCITMPMTKDGKRLEEAHNQGARQIISALEQGKSVAFLTLGDPTIYSTYLYLQKLVQKAGYKTEIINGVASFLAAGAALNLGLVEGEQQLHVIPSSYELADTLLLPGTKVLMKAGRNMAEVKAQVEQLDAQVYMVENCGMEQQRIYDKAEEIPEDAGYYSLVIIK